MSDDTLEARFAALKARIKEEFNTDLGVALTIGGVKANRLYRLRELDHAETLAEHLDTIERVVELPSFATVTLAEQNLSSIETALELAETVYAARLSEYNTARAQFDLDTDREAPPERRDTIQSVVEDIVELEAVELEAEKTEDDGSEATQPETPEADWSGGESQS